MTTKKVEVQQAVMAADLSYAQKIKDRLREKGILMVNLIGSPGSGKTTLLEKTLGKDGLRAAVIEGDVATDRDAKRIEATGVPSIQINTDGGCHLEANWVDSTIDKLPLDELDIIFVENVGNLVCPAEFDIGEDHKVAISSVPEGPDKPLKYPLLFTEASAVVLTKTDLLPYVPFDLDLYWGDVGKLNPKAKRLDMSCVKGEGLEEWSRILRGWLEEKRNG
ncbi:hydrogenase accessory protein HypB [Dethiosulfovibrio peptidovorans DSM 11002]|uniref:Hydrogenase accessory protein HypB n=1 Tax=Dethiosulfovibrio peptidovorans DSM 11002 TaxID=469381 RepID=D2Z4S1_9BACT|nr:hydrogenase nickel incorporation protein HypB [Dethiosulfovibrio peptidovorans]EFC92415.1 hydrogenase accessory protein HypB [Dethiosulfovibrio peptidovorans DSM 11002]